LLGSKNNGLESKLAPYQLIMAPLSIISLSNPSILEVDMSKVSVTSNIISLPAFLTIELCIMRFEVPEVTIPE